MVLKDGIGDLSDKINLLIVPGFTILVFAILWAAKLSEIAIDEPTCKAMSNYKFTRLEDDVKRHWHCLNGRRYMLGAGELTSLDPKEKLNRAVYDPNGILWFWIPIVFVMFGLTRFFWSILLGNKGINFQNVLAAVKSVTAENGITEQNLMNALPVIAKNFSSAYSTNALTSFLVFKFVLVLAPLVLLLFFLPLMIGPNYRTWGLDVAKACYDGTDWQGQQLAPLFGSNDNDSMHVKMKIPLIPRITYCDYHGLFGTGSKLTIRCYQDTNLHEKIALFIWAVLAFLAVINLKNFMSWLIWALKMQIKDLRRDWVITKWLNTDGLPEREIEKMHEFAKRFRMGQLLYFYFIEAHSDHVVAAEFCKRLYESRVDQNYEG